MKILVVEDHGYVGRLLVRLLSLRGHKAEMAGTLAEAIECCAAERFDLLLCDINLPDGDGWQLARQLLPRHPQLRAIALSGYSGPEYVQKSKAAGFDLHMTKPVSLEDLEAAIRRVMA